MKKVLLLAFMMVCMFTVLSLSPVTTKAQTSVTQSVESKDSAALLATPIFTGAEQNLKDSLLSIGRAAVDPETKAVISDAVAVLKDTPEQGGLEGWYAYVVAAVGVLFGLYQYFKRRWTGTYDPQEV